MVSADDWRRLDVPVLNPAQFRLLSGVSDDMSCDLNVYGIADIPQVPVLVADKPQEFLGRSLYRKVQGYRFGVSHEYVTQWCKDNAVFLSFVKRSLSERFSKTAGVTKLNNVFQWTSSDSLKDNEEALKHVLKDAFEKVRLEYSNTRLETVASTKRSLDTGADDVRDDHEAKRRKDDAVLMEQELSSSSGVKHLVGNSFLVMTGYSYAKVFGVAC